MAYTSISLYSADAYLYLHTKNTHIHMYTQTHIPTHILMHTYPYMHTRTYTYTYRADETLKEGKRLIDLTVKSFKDVKTTDRSLIWNTDLVETLELRNLLGE